MAFVFPHFNRWIRLKISIGVAFALIILLTFMLGFFSVQHNSEYLQSVTSQAGGTQREVYMSCPPSRQTLMIKNRFLVSA